MKKLNLLSAFFILLICSCAVPNMNLADAPNRYIGYVPLGNLDYEANSQFYNQTTHLNLCFFNADEQGNIVYHNQSDAADLELVQFVEKAQNNGQKVLISLGGGISDDSPLIAIYEKILADDYRTDFIKNLMDYVNQFEVDGLDIDLEYKCINQYYNVFIQELAAALHTEGKLLTCAIAKYQGVLLTKKTLESYDFLNLMIYDYTGLGSDIPGDLGSYKHVEREMDYWTGLRGIDAKKIVIGVPYYGYWWEQTPAGATVTKGAISYKGLTDLYPQQIKTLDNFTVTKDNGNTVTYCTNSIATIKEKAKLSRYYGGIMCWHLLNDSADAEFNLGGVVVGEFRK
jgi:spore germination protein YaaH